MPRTDLNLPMSYRALYATGGGSPHFRVLYTRGSGDTNRTTRFVCYRPPGQETYIRFQVQGVYTADPVGYDGPVVFECVPPPLNVKASQPEQPEPGLSL